MTAIRTRVLTLSLIASDADLLEALATAQNGSIHNVASRVIRRGVMAELATGPTALRERHNQALRLQRLEGRSQIIQGSSIKPEGAG